MDKIGHSNVLLAISLNSIAIEISKRRLDKTMDLHSCIFAVLGLEKYTTKVKSVVSSSNNKR